MKSNIVFGLCENTLTYVTFSFWTVEVSISEFQKFHLSKTESVRITSCMNMNFTNEFPFRKIYLQIILCSGSMLLCVISIERIDVLVKINTVKLG